MSLLEKLLKCQTEGLDEVLIDVLGKCVVYPCTEGRPKSPAHSFKSILLGI